MRKSLHVRLPGGREWWHQSESVQRWLDEGVAKDHPNSLSTLWMSHLKLVSNSYVTSICMLIQMVQEGSGETDPQLAGNKIFGFYESLKFQKLSGVYLSNIAPCLLNEELSHCGHIYDVNSSRRNGCHTLFFSENSRWRNSFGHFSCTWDMTKAGLLSGCWLSIDLCSTVPDPDTEQEILSQNKSIEGEI